MTNSTHRSAEIARRIGLVGDLYAGWQLASLARDLEARPSITWIGIQADTADAVRDLAKLYGYELEAWAGVYKLTLADGLSVTPSECFMLSGSTAAWDSVDSMLGAADIEPGTRITVEHRKVVPNGEHLPSVEQIFDHLSDDLELSEITEAVEIDLTHHLRAAIGRMLEEAERAMSGWMAGDLIREFVVEVTDDGWRRVDAEGDPLPPRDGDQ